MPDLDFSFSGIKTAFLYFIRDAKKKEPTFVEDNLNDLCASIQNHLITMLVEKLTMASEKTGITQIAIAGGVSANSGLRKTLLSVAKKNQWNVFIPAFEYCTDNAGMIAMAAHYKYLKGEFSNLEVSPMARMAL